MAIVTNVTTPITQTNITVPPISIVSTTNNVTSTKQEDNIIVTTELITADDAISIAEEDISISNDDHLVTTNVTSEVVTQKSLLPNNITSEDNTILSDDNSSDILQHGDGNQNDTKFITVGDGDALVMGQEVAEHSEFIITQPFPFFVLFLHAALIMIFA